MKQSAFAWALVLIVVGGLGISIVLFPFYQQVSLMLADEGEYRQALQRYQEEASQGEDTLPILVSTVKMLQELAKEQQGITLTENYVAHHPDDLGAVDFLLKLYGDTNRELEFLQLYQARGPRPPSEELLRSVQKTTESLGYVDQEVPVLEELVNSHDALPKEYYRLAYFLSAKHEDEKAVDVVRKMLQKFPIDTLSNLKIDLAIRILVRQNHIDEAIGYAKAVIESKLLRTEYFDVVSIFIEEKHLREALVLMDILPEKARNSDLGYEVRLSVLDTLGEGETYFDIVNALVDTKRMNTRLFIDTLSPSLDEGSLQLLLKMINSVDLRDIPIQNLSEIAVRAVDRDETPLADAIYKGLSWEHVDIPPALLLALSLGMGEVSQTEATKSYNSIETRLSDREKAFLAPLFEIRGMDTLAKRVLGSVTSLTGFMPSEAFGLAMKFVGFGMLSQGEQLIDEYAQSLAIPPIEVQSASILIDIAKGETQHVVTWMNEQVELPESVLKGFFSAAYDKKNAVISELAAQRLVDDWPNTQYTAYLAAAWAIGSKEKEGLAILRKLFTDGEPVATLYVDALAYRQKEEPELQQELKRVVQEELQNPMVSQAQLRRLGYLLINAHLANIASPLFEKLASHSTFAGDDMQALLYVWGAHPTPAQDQWLVQKAIAAPARDEVSWLTYFNQRDQPRAMLRIIEGSSDGNQGDPVIRDLHFQALVTLKEKDEAKELLVSMLEEEPDRARLTTWIDIAKGGDFQPGVQTLYRHVIEKFPEDTEALKALGMIEFDRGDIITAKEYLERYLDLAEADFMVNYYYGQVLEYHNCFCSARIFYRSALQQLQELEPTFENKVFLTHILVRLECYGEAEEWYLTLIDLKPLQLGLYSELADLYIDRECYGEAQATLDLGFEVADNPELPEGQEEGLLLLDIQQIRLLKELNCIAEAIAYADALICEFPENSQVYSVAADLEVLAGNWGEGIDLVETAIDIACERTVLWDQLDAIIMDHLPYWSAGIEYRTSGGQHETLLRYHYEDDLWCGYRFFTDLEMDHGVVCNFVSFDTGEEFKLYATRERGALGLIQNLACGGTFQAGLLFAKDVAGIGLKTYLPDLYGSTTIVANYHEPCWDLVQSTFQEGARNRIVGTRVLRPFPRSEVYGTLGYNEYLLKTNQSMATSYLLQGGYAYRLSKLHPWVQELGCKGEIALTYALDKEHVLSQVWKDGINGPFQPLGLANREIHSGSMVVTKYFYDWLSIDGSAGYSFDRAARRGGAEGTFGMTYGRKYDVQWRLFYRHSMSTTGLTSAEDAVSLDVRSPIY